MMLLTHERFSDLIGMIYDCALEPDCWSRTIAEICQTIDCMSGLMLLIDLQRSSQHRLAYAWGMKPDWERRFLSHSDLLSGFYQRAFSRTMCPDGEPQVLSSLVVGSRARSVYAELTLNEGISEAMQTVVLRQSKRLAVLGVNRHESARPLADNERAIIRLLVPHIRRAVTISDVLDIRKLETHTLTATLDSFSTGVVVVGDRGRILHANGSARSMFSAAGPVADSSGFLKAHDADAHRELANAIAVAQRNEAAIGAAGIGVALGASGGEPSIAHVLPLTGGDLRTRLVPQATAAVFITQAEAKPAANLQAVADNFDLTPAEARVLEHLAGGATVAETAQDLGISLNTAKTHLARIFSKTGAARQADLIALVNRLVPPIHRPTN
jgi:DNA-binding CsgD family transcriptional regulator/PAS domain-containing protein